MSIIRFSTIQHARHLEFDHVSTTRLRIEILHRIGTSMANYAPMTDDMFKLAIINKFNTAFCFHDIIQSQINFYYIVAYHSIP